MNKVKTIVTSPDYISMRRNKIRRKNLYGDFRLLFNGIFPGFMTTNRIRINMNPFFSSRLFTCQYFREIFPVFPLRCSSRERASVGFLGGAPGTFPIWPPDKWPFCLLWPIYSFSKKYKRRTLKPNQRTVWVLLKPRRNLEAYKQYFQANLGLHLMEEGIPNSDGRHQITPLIQKRGTASHVAPVV